jgi:predicted SAM-dependent methyltransferase
MRAPARAFVSVLRAVGVRPGRLLRRVFRYETLLAAQTDITLMLRATPRRRVRSIKSRARYLNIGAGGHGVRSEEWLNVDGFDRRADVLCNAARPLPFEDARFEGIFTEHLLEHLTVAEAAEFLRECRRVLKRHGVIRVVVPDGELYIRNYLSDRTWMMERRTRCQFHTPMEVINEVARQKQEHQYMYDFETLALKLSEAGFGSIRRCAFQRGEGPQALLIDRQARAFESLYVEAIRV